MQTQTSTLRSRPIIPLPQRARGRQEQNLEHDLNASLASCKPATELIEHLLDLVDWHPAYSAHHPLIRTTNAAEVARRVRDNKDSNARGNAEKRGDSKIGLQIGELLRRECPTASKVEFWAAKAALQSNRFFFAILRRKGLCDRKYDKKAANAFEIIFHHLSVVDPCAAEALAIDLLVPAIHYIMDPRPSPHLRQPLGDRMDNVSEERPAKRARTVEDKTHPHLLSLLCLFFVLSSTYHQMPCGPAAERQRETKKYRRDKKGHPKHPISNPARHIPLDTYVSQLLFDDKYNYSESPRVERAVAVVASLDDFTFEEVADRGVLILERDIDDALSLDAPNISQGELTEWSKWLYHQANDMNLLASMLGLCRGNTGGKKLVAAFYFFLSREEAELASDATWIWRFLSPIRRIARIRHASRIIQPANNRGITAQVLEDILTSSMTTDDSPSQPSRPAVPPSLASRPPNMSIHLY
uniref:Uncharacterized protein n=1 Tax=Mycena chlorophos TaxID=658473 RepID=A0ABQ0LUK1_MYCCL|nr:predicted protein [Mycena chlorophos]